MGPLRRKHARYRLCRALSRSASALGRGGCVRLDAYRLEAGSSLVCVYHVATSQSEWLTSRSTRTACRRRWHAVRSAPVSFVSGRFVTLRLLSRSGGADEESHGYRWDFFQCQGSCRAEGLVYDALGH